MRQGILFGITAGLIPGPLMVYLIVITMKHGRKKGVTIACLPLLTELPIISLVALGISSSRLPSRLLTSISIGGSLVLLRMAYNIIRQDHSISLDQSNDSHHYLYKGILVTLFNPNPYIFRLTVGASIMQNMVEIGGSVRHIVIGFFIMFIGINILITFFAHYIKQHLHSTRYQYIIKGLGILLGLMGIAMLWKAIAVFI